jgi:hypothetical protein
MIVIPRITTIYSQRIIAKSAGITSVTLANRVRDLKKLLCNNSNSNKALSNDINRTPLASSSCDGLESLN